MRTAFIAVLFLLLTIAVHAALPEEFGKNFRPVDGVVIKVVDGEYLLDLGSQSGVRDGDLLAVLAPGEPVKHPVTGAVIGQIDHAKAFLRISRVKPDFSWARSLSADVVIHPAEAVRRYGEVPALFIPTDETDHDLFNDLQTALPHLAWRPWGETALNGPGLIFSRTGNELIVRDHSGTRLGAWPLLIAPRQPVAVAATPAALQPVAHKYIGKGRGLVVADLDGDDSTEIAVALENRIEIGRVNGTTWKALTEFELPLPQTILSIDAADLDGDKHSELLITAVRGEKIASQIWSCSAQSCRAVATAIPWYFRVVDLPGRGPTPLAQQEAASSSGSDYFEPPFTFTWLNGKLTAGGALALPPNLAIHGMQPFGTNLWANLDSSDRLNVTDQSGEILWTSREKFSGSETFIDKQPVNKRRDESRRFYLPLRLARDGETIIVPQNDSSGTFTNLRRAETSRLVGLRWNGDTLTEAWRTPTRDGYLADFVRVDLDNDGQDDFLLLGSTSTGFFSGSRSTLYRWQK